MVGYTLANTHILGKNPKLRSNFGVPSITLNQNQNQNSRLWPLKWNETQLKLKSVKSNDKTLKRTNCNGNNLTYICSIAP